MAAERNNRPEVKSDERKRAEWAVMCRCAEWRRVLQSWLKKPRMMSEYPAELCLDCVELGYPQTLHHLSTIIHSQAKDAGSVSGTSGADGISKSNHR